MKLIADGGSTKTAWRLISNNKSIQSCNTQGFSPYFVGTNEIIEILRNELNPHLKFDCIDEVYYYGTGCSNPGQIDIVANAFHQLIPNAKVEIYHDLLASARATCGDETGLAGILGTGSNSCFYDGKIIQANVVSLGYVLGDEGSGAYMGRQLVRDFLYRDMPDEFQEIFAKRFQVDKDIILENVYKKPLANRYLAAFTIFLSEQKQHDYCFRLVFNALSDFFDKHICKYDNYREYPFHAVGSIAYHFADVLREVAISKGVKCGKILESPIDGLVDYYGNEKWEIKNCRFRITLVAWF